MSTKKEPQLNFSEIWERITKRTKIKNQAQLADLIGIKPVNISKKKKADEFPVYWAYIVATEYKLSLDWLITGKEPIQAESGNYPTNSLILLINEWFEEMRMEDIGREEWFRCNFEDSFPSFKSWVQRKKAAVSGRRILETVA
ncbi:MAG: helix-turn-helix domain-containing protein [Candidatus Electronema sp. V4]|uniref:helix-turn-helix domain-containing protein n=1 Tax=Candidatus Electronema sp. V4 TaxID=3454756 RepID=UPI0040558DFE